MKKIFRKRLLLISLLIVATFGGLALAAALNGCGSPDATSVDTNANAGTDEYADAGPTCGISPGPGAGDAQYDQTVIPNNSAYTALSYKAGPNPARVLDVPVLMFHHVGEPPADADRLRRDLTVPAANFDAMLSYMQQNGYHPISETELYRALILGEALPAKPVMITFDDGYEDAYEVARPILQKYAYPATFYIISDKIGQPEYLTWDLVKELDRQGMDIGSHTIDHKDLTTLSDDQLRHELADSASIIGTQLNHPVYWFCYPSGKFDARVERITREAGYLLATTTTSGDRQSSDAPLRLLRFRMRPTTDIQQLQELLQS